MKLTWHRTDESGKSRAETPTHIYFVTRRDCRALLAIYDAKPVGGQFFAAGGATELDSHDRVREAKATAQAYEDLGEGYQPQDHERRSRYTQAVVTVYARTS